jgi:hypothetical protein
MNSQMNVLKVLGVLAFLCLIFLYGSQLYFDYREIQLASDGCYKLGGTPIVEREYISSSYSFSCDVHN